MKVVMKERVAILKILLLLCGWVILAQACLGQITPTQSKDVSVDVSVRLYPQLGHSCQGPQHRGLFLN